MVIPLLDDATLRIQRLRIYRSGTLDGFLLVARDGRRFAGSAEGIHGLDFSRDFSLGLDQGILGAVFGMLLLDPHVRLRLHLEEDGSEALQDTKDRIYEYLRLNPGHYTWASPASLRRRVARAKTMEELVTRFIAD